MTRGMIYQFPLRKEKEDMQIRVNLNPLTCKGSKLKSLSLRTWNVFCWMTVILWHVKSNWCHFQRSLIWQSKVSPTAISNSVKKTLKIPSWLAATVKCVVELMNISMLCWAHIYSTNLNVHSTVIYWKNILANHYVRSTDVNTSWGCLWSLVHSFHTVVWMKQVWSSLWTICMFS